VDLEALLETRKFMESHLEQEPTRGAIARAGLPKDFVRSRSA
jgi:hypothetical protein